MDDGSRDSFEFDEPHPGPMFDFDRWFGELVRRTLASLLYVLYYPPPTQIRFLRRASSFYSFHTAGITSILLFGFRISLQFNTFLRILLLGVLLMLCTLSVYWGCCITLEILLRILDFNGLFINESHREFLLYEDVFLFDDDSFDEEFLDEELSEEWEFAQY